MDFEKYTERSRGFIQSAQALALREGHQRFTPEHLLKVLLESFLPFLSLHLSSNLKDYDTFCNILFDNLPLFSKATVHLKPK